MERRFWQQRRMLFMAAGIVVAAALLATTINRASTSGPIVSLVAGTRDLVSLVVDTRTSQAFVLWRSDPPHPARIVLIDTRSGHVLRSVPLGSGDGDDEDAMVIDQATDRVFVAVDGYDATGPLLGVLDARTGHVVAQRLLPGERTLLTVDERAGTVIAASTLASASQLGKNPARATTIMTLNVTTGTMRHRVTVDGFAAALDSDSHAGRTLVLTERGSLPPQNAAATLIALDDRTGQIAWQRAVHLRAGPLTPFLVVDSATHRAVVSERSTVAVIDTRTGRIVGRANTHASPNTALVIGAGRAVVTSTDYVSIDKAVSHLLLLDLAHGGRVVQSLVLPGTLFSLASDAPHHRLLVAQSGTGDLARHATPTAVLVLNDRTARRLTSVPLKGVLDAVAYDPQSGHLFVIASVTDLCVAKGWSLVPGIWRLGLHLPLGVNSSCIIMTNIGRSTAG